ncbi:chemotaxis protein [Corallococcus sp. M34]|uniref:chemotaxis protein n=1 Tax=Citreicoccus inhibens TaxID=2849499 RepID=UPI001C24A7D8|nr:chemotaxis protein [Citreicoccus inhibens]MBU8895047.1 chemotaxis protein [Citreicoccus inhibens]
MATCVRSPRLVLGVVLALGLAACASVQPPRSLLAERVGRSDLSVGVLRTRVRDLARRFSGLIEAMADGLAERSDSADVARAMLTFKSNAVPAMQGALFQADPVAALVDAWALLAQLEDALPASAARASPELLAQATRSLDDMEAQVEAQWRHVTGRSDVSPARARVHAWATAHPLTGPLVARESTASLLADVADVSGGGLLQSAAGLVEDTQDLTARVDLYAASLPRQARWQAELVAVDALESPALRTSVSELSRTVDILASMGERMADLPALVDRERVAVTAAVARERVALQVFFTGERQAVLADLSRERIAVMLGLHSERVATLEQLDGVGRGWVEESFTRATRLVDRVFLWLFALVGLGLVGGFGVGLVLLRAWRQAARRQG